MGAPPSPQFNIFTPDGQLVSVPPTAQARTIGLGHWTHARNREYHTTFWFHRFDASGIFVGSTKVLGRLLLDESGDSYSGDFKGTLYDVSGAMTGPVPGGTLAGRRLYAGAFE